MKQISKTFMRTVNPVVLGIGTNISVNCILRRKHTVCFRVVIKTLFLKLGVFINVRNQNKRDNFVRLFYFL